MIYFEYNTLRTVSRYSTAIDNTINEKTSLTKAGYGLHDIREPLN